MNLRTKLLQSSIGALWILLLTAGCKPGPPEISGPPTRIFLISVDTLRADHLGLYGYGRDTSPVLDQLGEQATVFERAFAQWPKTGPSLASMFLGTYPETNGLTHNAAITLPRQQLTLPEFLRASGYKTYALIGNAVISRDLGWAQGFDEFIEPWGELETFPEARKEFKRLLDAPSLHKLAMPLIDRMPVDEPVFAWFHYIDPHDPYTLPDGESNPFLDDSHEASEEEIHGKRYPLQFTIDGQKTVGFYVSQYDANVKLADRYIGALLDRLEDRGLLEDALILFTADHGESLGSHRFFGHGSLPYNNGLHVPLVFHSPKGRIATDRRIADPVQLVDVYPTLADLIGSPHPEGLEGKSLARLMSPNYEPAPDELAKFRYAFAGAGDSRTPWIHYSIVQDARFKLTRYRDLSGEQAEGIMLFDLNADPEEVSNVADQHAKQVERLLPLLDQKKALSADRPAGERTDNERVNEALRALGYLN